MGERRQHPRQSVGWPVRLWLSESFFLAGNSLNASPHGTWVNLIWLPSGVLKLGEAYRLDVCPGRDDEFSCTAVVRRVDRQGIGLEILEELPVTADRESSPLVAAVGRGGITT